MSRPLLDGAAGLRHRTVGVACAFAMLTSAAGLSACGKAARRTAANRIDHVFVIMLENQGFDTTFGPRSPAPYLADTLVRQGAFLRQYFGTGHLSLDNYVAIVSGIAPSPETQSDCPRYLDFTETGVAADGQPIGRGCVYPAHVQTIANQLAGRGLTWKGYMEDMGNDTTREAARCGHPVLGTADMTQRAIPTDQYASKHDPFVYFHSLIDTPACAENVVPLTELEAALQRPDRTPNFAFITPNLCHDGHDRPCRDGEPGGLASANDFLRHWVPIITASPAFKSGGLLIITFDEALSHDAEACCGEVSGPNTPRAGVNGPGGGRTGAVLLSPFITPGSVSNVPYNHYSTLRSIEDIFGLEHLGYAAAIGLTPFGSDVYGSARAYSDARRVTHGAGTLVSMR